MKSQLNKKENRFDQTLEQFVQKYKYELLASFGLLALLGGIILAVMFFNRTPEEITVISSQDSVEENLQKIWVDIGGAVVNPGVYELEQGSRIKDLLEKAGLLKGEADQAWVDEFLNQAEVLQDGQKIYIPSKHEEKEQVVSQANSESNTDAVGRTAAAQILKISLNRASLEELITLPGIGPSYAQKIINARPINKIDELLNISGIGPKRFEQIKDLVTVY